MGLSLMNVLRLRMGNSFSSREAVSPINNKGPLIGLSLAAVLPAVQLLLVAYAAIGTDLTENTILLWLFTGHYIATAVVKLLISRLLLINGSTCYNILCYQHRNSIGLE
jgi:energy-converting hydrogenase Eha subunit G